MSGKTTNVLKLEFETERMLPQQVRLIKQINHLLLQLAITPDEEEYFHQSAELLRLCASLIKQANFIVQGKKDDIPYSDQALEYAIDSLNEHIIAAKVITFDN